MERLGREPKVQTITISLKMEKKCDLRQVAKL